MPSNPRIAVRSVNRPTTRARPAKKKKKVVTFIPKLHSGEDDRALYYMFTYKMKEGRRPLSVHGGYYNYGATKCEHMFNRKGRCPQGRKCRFAHTSLEVLFHPLVYRTRQCDKDDCKQGDECAWAHSEGQVREILLDWWKADPVSDWERREIRQKKARKKNVRRVRLEQPIVRGWKEDDGGDDMESEEYEEENEQAPSNVSDSSSSARASGGQMSVSSSSRARTPQTYESLATEEAMSVSTSVSGGVKEASEKVVEMKERGEAEVVVVREKSLKENGPATEFERWYRSTFNCEFLSWAHYLSRFEAKELDDVGLLWDLYMESRKKRSSVFSDVLVNEISMVDETARALFVQRLCELKSPVDVRGWLERVVGLPEYSELFVASIGEGCRVDDLVHLGVDGDDLAEMGVSLVGHRMKILHHLKKFGEFDL